MATYCGTAEVGVRGEDILEASRTILDHGVQSEAPFGSNRNQWQRPVTEYGSNTAGWEINIKASPYVGDIDFGRKEWAQSRKTVDTVMSLILREMRAKAEKYEGLRIDSYIRQGSSRDGLKVIAADEFDSLIEFHIDGLPVQEYILESPIDKHDRRVPGYCYLLVKMSAENLEKKYPKLWREGVFQKDTSGNVFFSSKMLHQRVFESLVDQSWHSIRELIREEENISFFLTRRMNPPAVNITIHVDDDTNVIDLDIVPGILLKVDTSTTYQGQVINAPIHAVCKWKEEEALKALEFVDQNLVWQIISFGYEKYTLDIARDDQTQRQRHILTALRILKTYMTKAAKENRPPPQITTVLQSYHLKQIALWLIMYLCHFHTSMRIDGVAKALAYIIDFLNICLEEKRLPHFFYSNSRIQEMYPNYPIQVGALRFDLFRKIPTESLNQAQLSLKNRMCKDLGFVFAETMDQEQRVIKTNFREEISHGEYF